MAVLNYTTIKSAEETISEIQRLLAGYGVQGILVEYDGKQVAALSFRIDISGQLLNFKLPCNWRSVRALFEVQGVTKAKLKHRDRDLDNQAIRTAWRIILVWVEAQLNLVEINMVSLPQVFLPYFVMKDGRTLAETVALNPQFLLGSGGGES